MKIHGFIGKEIIARGSRNNESIFVNNRYIKNKTIVAAVENAFKSFSTISKFPFFVLFIDLPPEDIDVNIHPTKAEIKFKDERIVYKRVFDTVHHALKEDIFNSFAETKKSEPTETIEEIKLDLDNNYINDKIDEPLIQNKVEPSINDIYNNITVHDVAKEEELYNRLKEINKNKSISSINNFINDDNEKYNSSFNENNIVNPDNNNGNSHISNINSQFSSSGITYDNTQNQAISTESIKSESKAKFPDLRIIGQFNKTYI